MKRIISITCIIIFFICMLIFPQSVFQGASTGLLLWFNTVLPTLLPFLILSNLLIHTGAVDMVARVISPVLCRLFRVSPYGAFTILTGFLCGCPMGSKVTADLLKKGNISKNEGRYLLSFCNNTSPMFMVSYVIWQNLGCADITVPLLSITLLTPVLLSFPFRFIYHIPKNIAAPQAMTKHTQPYQPGLSANTFGLLDDCIMNGFETITRIGGYIMLFSIGISLIKQIPSANPFLLFVLLPSLELTSGVAMISCAALPLETKILAALTLSAFGGWCAAAQTNAMIQDTELPLLPYILEKLVTALATSLLVYEYLLLC